MDRGLGCADEVREGLALAACRECRVEQRRGVGATDDVGVADAGLLAVWAGERDLPGAEPPIGVRDLRLRLLAGEPAEVNAADADARQDPVVVLLAPGVQDSGADADGEQDSQDERDAEAEGERPSAPGPCRGLAVGHGGREGQDRHGIGARVGGRRRVHRSGVGRLARRRRIGGGRISWRDQRGVGVVRRCGAPDERRELGVAGGRLAVGCGGVGSPVGCGVGQVGHQMLMRGRPAPGIVPGGRDILACARDSVIGTVGPTGLGREAALGRYATGPPARTCPRSSRDISWLSAAWADEGAGLTPG